jgi:two-component system nitrate/nitrite response regulator NarL
MHMVPALVIDPSALFRKGLKSLLVGGDIQVVGDVAGLADISTVAVACMEIQLVLCDYVAGSDVQETMAELRVLFPKARIVMLTVSANPHMIIPLIQAGVDGCLTKNISTEVLKQSLRLVMLGEKVFPSSLVAMMLGNQLIEGSFIGALSPREIDILRHLVNGDTNKMIAKRIGITEMTVKFHLKSLLGKVGACNRTQAAIWAFNNGFNAS